MSSASVPMPSPPHAPLASNRMVMALADLVRDRAPALLAGQHDSLLGPLVDRVAANVAPNGSTVVALTLDEQAHAGLAAAHQWVDLFLLGGDARLGAHYHRHASATIIIVNGTGTALVDGTPLRVQPGDLCHFPAGAVHDVCADSQPMLFLSFQDHPILAADGTLDYHVAAAAAG